MRYFTSVFVLFFIIIFSVSAQSRPVQPQPKNGSDQMVQADRIRYYEQYVGTLVQQLKNVQDQNADLEARIARLEQKIADTQNEKKEIQNEIEALKKQIKQESETRQDHIRNLIASIEKLAAVPSTPRPYLTTAKRKTTSDAASDSSEEYEEYIVQKGASLSAIATAYKVSVQDIRKANNLKGDVIRPGQKLLIPIR